jgi:hypothetical protein
VELGTAYSQTGTGAEAGVDGVGGVEVPNAVEGSALDLHPET